jgi:hypothetical protein
VIDHGRRIVLRTRDDAIEFSRFIPCLLEMTGVKYGRAGILVAFKLHEASRLLQGGRHDAGRVRRA